MAPFLTDAQWARIAPLLPQPKRRPHGGRPRADDRACLEGILWVLRTGARWRDLPDRYPSPATCWRRLGEWERQDVWLTLWRAFLSDLDERGQLDWSEAFLDATFAPAKKGAPASASHVKVRGQSLAFLCLACMLITLRQF
jgi:transposase